MIPYWLLFGYVFFAAMLSNSSASGRQPSTFPFLVGIAVIAAMVGLRLEVGADWFTYELLYRIAGRFDLWRALSIGDPGYQLVNWTGQQLGFGLWLVNLVCALVFAWGLYRFASAQADPWLALVVAVPYLVIVVAMGYTRQSVAIGIIMAGLASLQRGGSIVKFAVYVAFAALFHKTAVVVLPLVVFAAERNRLLNMIAGIAAIILLYDLFLADSVDQFVTNYIEAEYSSQGAAIRVAMNLVPAAIYLAARNRFRYLPLEDRIWRNYSLAAWLFLALLIVVPSSTAVDRLALYIIPLQLAVLSRLPRAFDSSSVLRLAVMAYSGIVLFVWLNFARHAHAWIPYQFYPLS